MWIALRWEMAS